MKKYLFCIVLYVAVVAAAPITIKAAFQFENTYVLKIIEELKRFIELEQLYQELGDITEWETFTDEQMEKLIDYFKKSYENMYIEMNEIWLFENDDYLKILDVELGNVWFYQNYERPFIDGLIYLEVMDENGNLVYLAQYYAFNCDNLNYYYLDNQLTTFRMPLKEEEIEALKNKILEPKSSL